MNHTITLCEEQTEIEVIITESVVTDSDHSCGHCSLLMKEQPGHSTINNCFCASKKKKLRKFSKDMRVSK